MKTLPPDSATRRPTRWPIALGLLVLAALWAGVRLPAQTPGVRVHGQFEVPFLDKQNRRISLLTGSQAILRGGGDIFLAVVQVESYDSAGRTNLHVFGTNCVFNPTQQRAQSTNALRVVSGDGRLVLNGRGFTWWQTNNTLVISNAVRTRLQRLPGATNEPLRIRSDRLRAQLNANVVEFLGHVQARDPEIDLTCARLAVRRNLRGDLDRIEATGGVVVRDLRDGSRITAGQALYHLAGTNEWVEFSGQPRWESGSRSATAERFVLDRRQHRVTAVGNARIVLPRSTASLTGLMSPADGAEPAQSASSGRTHQLVELQAGQVTLQLPATNGPVQEVLATTNVLIRLPAEGLTARAQQAAYLPGGRFRLKGEPSWTWGRRSGSGDLIEFGTNGTFRIAGHARLRFPVAGLRAVLSGATNAPPAGGRADLTNVFVEVRSKEVDYRDGVIRFGDDVQGRCTDGDTLLGTMRSDELLVGYRDRLESVTAEGNVLAEQLPQTTADGKRVGRTLSADRVSARLGAGGRLSEVEATGQVAGAQTEKMPDAPRPVISRLHCESAHAWLAPNTNRVDRLTATGGVRVTREGRMAWGSRADYTADDGRLRLTGGPLVLLPEGRVLGAKELTWNPATGRFGGKGLFRTYWSQVPINTNALVFRPPPVSPPSFKR